MSNDLNILILSCGTRNKIVQYFKHELANKGQVIATDCDKLAPALYEADKHYIVPRVDEEGYLDKILSICKENKIKGILSLIDPELSILSKYRQSFLDVGTIPIVSDYDLVEICFDKYKMFEYLVDKGFPTVKSYIDKEKFYSDVQDGVIDYPVFVKPVKGSASLNINKVSSKEEIDLLFSRYDNLIIQEFMDGIEYGLDVYIDMISGEPTVVFIKEKIKMRAGETDKSKSIKDPELLELIKRFLRNTNFKGIIDMDVFKVNDTYYISEVNPRFGGGFPHAYESGVNVPEMIMNNIRGRANLDLIDSYEEGTYMLKYNDLRIIKN